MYGKLFPSMYDGTLSANWKALVTFQQLLILCDRDGIVDITPRVLAKRTGIPRDIIDEGLKVLSEPDPESRTKDEDGRRIVLLNPDNSWGWRIVNHRKYREMKTIEDRREYMRKYMREYRLPEDDSVNNKSLQELTEVNSKHQLAQLTHADADADADALTTISPENDISKDEKQRYLEFVWLTSGQRQKLIDTLGLARTEEMIKRVEEYVGTIGEKKANKKYDSHYHVILTWHRGDIAKGLYKPAAGTAGHRETEEEKQSRYRAEHQEKQNQWLKEIAGQPVAEGVG